ncbi:MAG: ABC transporter permease [Bacteroidia bacterium]
MLIQRFTFNFRNGLEALLTNKIRAFLTSLGIIFGVAAVITMLAIGRGAEKEILEQIKQVGSNNIIIKPIIKTNEEKKKENDAGEHVQRASEGLTLKDAENILATLPIVESVSPETELQGLIVREGMKENGKVVGVTNAYFDILDFSLSEGKWFTAFQYEHAEPVCIIGKKIAAKFFSTAEPIGNEIKIGNNWLRVVGVLASKNINESSSDKLSIRNSDKEIYTPIKTFLLRYRNRGLATIGGIKAAAQRRNDENNNANIDKNSNQLDRLVVKIRSTEFVKPSVEILQRMLLRRHNSVEDFEIVVPELLLKQEQKTRNLFNMVLGIIASISLLVGGIGIMNIMLATVLERVKEIGLRMSLGASKQDILLQFISESVTISVSGGVVGIILGIILCYLVQFFTEIPTIISGLSVFVAFTISISVGLVFGILPAKRAADQDPAESLRTG